MKQVRVGVIGVGYLGKFHAEKYSRMDNVHLTGVVDIDQSLAEETASGFSTRAFGDYSDLFGHVDAVSIVVPTEDHFTIAADCLKHDLDVLIEKPMTTTLEQADDLIEIAEAGKRILQVVGSIPCLSPKYRLHARLSLQITGLRRSQSGQQQNR